ncbi:MAG: prepilin peptidase [bacterium]|nr:prepilin peptidase [bacterium]
MTTFIYGLIFALGLAIGSFLNVVGLRYRPSRFLLASPAWNGRSRCPHCGKTLAWYELIPLVSFIYLRGKCRTCARPISLQYPLVELVTGITLVLVPFYLASFYGVATYAAIGAGFSWYYILSGIWVLAILALILMSIIDYRQRIIPDEIVVVIAALGAIKIAVLTYYNQVFEIQQSFLQNYAMLGQFWNGMIPNHIQGAVAALLFLGFIVLVTRGKGMGMGDVKLGGALGLLFGWPDILIVIMLAFFVGTLVTLPLLFRRARTLKDAVPFGPFLAGGALLTFFFGYEILKNYFSLFGI